MALFFYLGAGKYGLRLQTTANNNNSGNIMHIKSY